MAAMTKMYFLLCALIALVQRGHAGFEQDMQALENDLKDEEIKKSQKKSIADMTTEELIEELKRSASDNTKKEKSVKERFHDITKTAINDDLKNCYRKQQNRML